MGRPGQFDESPKRKICLRSLTLPPNEVLSSQRSKMKENSASSKHTINYSPKSTFLRDLRDCGKIIKIARSRPSKSPSTKSPESKFVRKCCQKKSTKKNVTSHRHKKIYCPSEDLSRLRDFRQFNWNECHPAEKKRNISRKDTPSHICTHEYKLSDRLLPEPLASSGTGDSLCSVCLVPSKEATFSKHLLLSLDEAQEIPDPYLYKPRLRPIKHRLITEAPTLSYIPHFKQRVGQLLTS
ncbi:uncharacterized protein LOC132198609 [Neocloeon triangulifer]|uniref:uncharacterized protein LOC132198609 n=1 Tax=Neocloeon triangulifer TaxID=2078957 RepID=UPI00286F2843|nr:uncharacterized protein LOC132198609 [Neocloeon triangulifer]